MRKGLAIMLIAIVVVISFAGCNIGNSPTGTTENGAGQIEDTTKTEDVSKEDITTDQIATEEITTEETTTEEDTACVITIFSPNENVDGLIKTKMEIDELKESFILDELIQMKVVLEGTRINKFEKREENAKVCLIVDFNDKLADLLYSCGTSGEYVVMASIVNTYLEAYDAESFEFTINGEVFESGHIIYDEPLGFFNMNN